MYTRLIARGRFLLGFLASAAAIYGSVQHKGNSTTAALDTHSNNLSADEGERSLRYHRPPAQELALGALDVVILRERTGVLPVSEPKAVMVRACGRSAKCGEDAKGPATHLLQGRSQCRG